MPDPNDMAEIFDLRALEELGGEGDGAKLFQVLQAQSSLIADADEVIIPEESILPDEEPKSEEELAQELAVQKADLKVSFTLYC